MPKKKKAEVYRLIDSPFGTLVITPNIADWCDKTEQEELARTFTEDDFVSDIVMMRFEQAVKLEIVRRLRAMIDERQP